MPNDKLTLVLAFSSGLASLDLRNALLLLFLLYHYNIAQAHPTKGIALVFRYKYMYCMYAGVCLLKKAV